MTSRAVKQCEKLIRQAVELGFTHQITRHALAVLIKKEIGSDPRTVKNWISNLQDFGFVKRVNSRVFTLNLNLVEGALELAVRNGSQKKLM